MLLSLQKSFNKYYETRINSKNICPQIININKKERSCEKRHEYSDMCNIKYLPNLNNRRKNNKYCNYFQSLGKFDQTSL